MSDTPYNIQERFPDKSDTITLLAAEDPEFRALCEDYDDCINALLYWEQSRETENKIRVDEYRKLVQELEEEIIQALVALKQRRVD